MFIRPSVPITTMVAPSVVLLDNHTTIRNGWKWEKYREDWNQYYSGVLSNNTNYDLRVQPFYFFYGGRVRSSVLDAIGSIGDYWSFTAYNKANAYRLDFYSGNLFPSHSQYRYNGFSIRCLAR